MVSVSLPGFDGYMDDDAVITADTETINVELIEQINSPGTLSVEYDGASTILSWGGGPGMTTDFETGELPEGWVSEGASVDMSGPIPAYFTVSDYTSDDVAPYGTYHAGLGW